MKKTLLQIVQEILSDMDSEDVNSISDTVEGLQIASIVETVFNNIIATREIPEHYTLLRVTAASNSERPTHFSYGTRVRKVDRVWYEWADGFYHEINWVPPLTFLERTDRVDSNYDTVLEQFGGTKLRIKNDTEPTFYTSFDDDNMVMNAYDSTVDSTLQSIKVRAYGVVYPSFTQSDSFVPDLDDTMFPYLIAEAKSTAMSLLKGSPDMKTEQAARRQKAYVQNDLYRTPRGPSRPNFGRS